MTFFILNLPLCIGNQNQVNDNKNLKTPLNKGISGSRLQRGEMLFMDGGSVILVL